MKQQVKAAVFHRHQFADRRFDQVKFSIIGEHILGIVGDRDAKVKRMNTDILVLPRSERPIGIAANGGTQNAAAFELGKWWYIRSSPRKTDSERVLSANEHDQYLLDPLL